MENNKIMKYVYASLGLIVCGFGVGFFLFGGLGVDPASVFVTAIAGIFNTTYGVASLFINLIIITIVFFIDRKYINYSSIAALFLIGFSADIMQVILGAIFGISSNIIFKFLIILVGLVVMSFGTALYTLQDLGIGAFDSISEIISRNLKKPYRWVRMAVDMILLIIGIILGGDFGVGTVIAAIMIGPAISFIRKSVFKISY